MKKLYLATALGSLILSSGCASIVNGTNQNISVTTHAETEMVRDAYCVLANNKGTWYVNTPGSTVVHRSYEDLSVNCKKDGHEPGMATVKSHTKGMAFGNIIFGGVIGAGIDMQSGAAYDYPTDIRVQMGQSVVLDKPAKKEDVAKAQ